MSIYLYPLISYLLGSISFGLLLSNWFGNGKLTESGSKNIGATNVLRTQGRLLGAATLVLDFLKAFLACTFFTDSGNEVVDLLVIAAPTIGHMFPIWLKFNGGKGVATYYGTLCFLDAYAFIITTLIFVVSFAASRIASLSCMISVIFGCGAFACARYIRHLDFFNCLCVLIVLAVLVIIRHHENIKRLLNNEEAELQL